MTINIDELIKSLGKNYQTLIDNEIISYKSQPKGASGSPIISLEMAQEGVFLAFWRDGQVLKSITLRIQHDAVFNWEFPNDLPVPLKKHMTRKWVFQKMGTPLRSGAPYVAMSQSFGWTDLYGIKGCPMPTSMQISYDITDNVRSLTYLPTSELRW